MNTEHGQKVDIVERRQTANEDSFVPRDETEMLLDKHMTRWGTLLERLK